MKCVVVIGGGVAGHLIARGLRDRARVVLVDPRDHLWVPMAGPRMLVEPALAERALVPWEAFLPGVEHVRGRAVGLSDASVRVSTDEGEREVAFDACVLATGASAPDTWVVPDGAGRAARRQDLERRAARVAAADEVLVVGGGAVGVEVAAELATATPARVTLVHGGSELLPGTGLGTLARRWFRARGVRVLLDDRVSIDHDGPFDGVTASGEHVCADVVIRCTGLLPNTCYVPWPSALDDRGRVRVGPTLQLVGHPRLFAAGDVTDVDERKLARNAAKHAGVIVGGVTRVLAGRDDLPVYRPDTGRTLLVTLGARDGLCWLPLFGAVHWPWLARWFKSSGVFVRKYRTRIGLQG